MVGQKLAHYQILEKLGEGGMGAVYKARDTHLDRFVAIKVLPPERVADPDRKRRFIQEAKAASALNHPHIVVIHDIASEAGADFMVMEYVSGRTLDHTIRSKGMRLAEVLKYAVQVADALAAAHEAGIIHRDVKPGNVMITDKGAVKVLDFGLAKLTEPANPEEAATLSIRPEPVTEEGTVLGTVAYMSPEQAEGKEVDARSDIFSFGSLLYEMFTGRRAFTGDSRMSTIMAVLRDEPKPPRGAGEAAPRDLEKILTRCLRKDPARRFQHMDDVKVALEELKEESDSGALAGSVAAPARNRRHVWAAALAGIAAVAVVTLLVSRPWRDQQPTPTPTLTPLTSYPGIQQKPSFSPDGNQIAFSWNGEKEDNFDIYVKVVGGGTPLRLTSNPAVDTAPAWSPDGRQIAFLRSPGEDAAVYLIPPLGGPERRLCDAKGDALAWTPDGRSLAIMDRTTDQEPYAIVLVAVDTGEKRRLTRPPPESVGDAPGAFSLDGRTLAFVRWPAPAQNDLFVISVKGGEPTRLTLEQRLISGATWLPAGDEIVFSSNRGGGPGLWRMRATPGAIATSMGIAGSFPVSSRPLRTEDVRLAYERRQQDVKIWVMGLSGPHSDGTPPTLVAPSTYSDTTPQLSPDGEKVAFRSTRAGAAALWLCNRDGSNVVQLTSLGDARAPRWSPDGSQIAFDARVPAGNLGDIYVVRSDGGAPRRLTTWNSDEVRPSWARDGRWIYFRSNRSGRNEVWKVPSLGGEPVQVTRNGGFEAQESPDGKLLYFVKDGVADTKARDYEKGSRPGGLWQMPQAGGGEKLVLALVSHSYWAVADKGVYFVDFTAASSAASPKQIRFFSFETGRISQVGVIRKELLRNSPGLSVTPDGRWLAWAQVDHSGSDLVLAEHIK